MTMNEERGQLPFYFGRCKRVQKKRGGKIRFTHTTSELPMATTKQVKETMTVLNL